MKKALLFIMMIGLIAGLVQAQVPKMELMWEKQVDSTIGYYNGYIKYDEKLGEPRITVSFVWTKPIAFDTLGRSDRFATLDLVRPKVDSGWAVWVTPDEKRVIAIFGASGEDWFLNDRYTFHGTEDTKLFFYDRQGRTVRKVATPYLSVLKMSLYQSRVYAVTGGMSSKGGILVNTLLCLDRDGRELWRKSEPYHDNIIDCGEDGSLFCMEYVGTKAKGDWSAKFYDKDGNLVNQVRFENVESAGSHAVMSKDGQYVALKFNDKLQLLSRSSPNPLWQTGSYNMWKDFDISSDGKYVAISVRGPSTGSIGQLIKTKVVLLNQSGQEIWNTEPDGWINPLFLGRHFLVMSKSTKKGDWIEKNKIRLYRIAVEGGR